MHGQNHIEEMLLRVKKDKIILHKNRSLTGSVTTCAGNVFWNTLLQERWSEG